MIQTLFGSLDEQQKPSFLDRMKEAVTRTRENLSERIEEVVSFGKEIDRATLDDLEATLLGADLGTTTTHEVLDKLREKADRKQIGNVDELKRLLKEEILAILTAADAQPVAKVDGTPEVILVVGVNGTGKTTTIGKLAQVLRSRARRSCCAPPILSAPPPSSNSKSGDSAPGLKSFAPRRAEIRRPCSTTRCRPRPPGTPTT